jgi:glutamate formiminotransferase
MRILECVPNISEGKDQKKIASIAEEVKKHKGVKLLDVSSDKDHHRSVITFLGEPTAVRNASLSMAFRAIELIDMREHRGAHPRLGAVDVVPFIPIQGVDMAEAVQVARDFGRELGEKFQSLRETALVKREGSSPPSERENMKGFLRN